jgi:deoxyribodipyrimidine photolyase-related protein
MFQTDFYKYQRQSRAILLEKNNNPVGGKWSFDEENRLKYPKGQTPPKVDFLKKDEDEPIPYPDNRKGLHVIIHNL